jgi:hypothetical protein
MSWNTKIPSRLIDFEAKTLPNTNHCIGVKMIASGGGSGTWVHIDEFENIVSLSDNYFEKHPVYSNITKVQLEGTQVMVKIPKFYIRTNEGKKFWIIPDPTSPENTQEENKKLVKNLNDRGFRLHPAFLNDNAEEVDYFLVGAYQSNISIDKCCSEPDVYPTANKSFLDYRISCLNRNTTGGVGGYHMWNIYEVAAITLLAMIECASTDFQHFYGKGRVNAVSLAKTSDASVISSSYRGITGLWGNAWQFVDGISTDINNRIVMKGFHTDKDGNIIRREFVTDNVIKTKESNDTIWVDGVSRGYFTSLNTDVGQGYNFNDIFLPDFNTLTEKYENATFSDFVYTRTAGGSKKVCCVGGNCDFATKAGLFCYNFDVSQTDTFDNIVSRLAKY